MPEGPSFLVRTQGLHGICGFLFLCAQNSRGSTVAIACQEVAQPRVFLAYSVPMKGNPKVISELNKALREELTAINQYFLHAEMCENWKYHRLSDHIKKQSIGEMKHAEVLIERILFLDGTPTMQPLELKVSGTVKGMLENDLSLELSAVRQYNDAVQIATKEGDNGSRDLLVQLLKDEESHVDWLEGQLHQIGELGYERYLMQQMGGGAEGESK